MASPIFIYYERIEPKAYPAPRDLRSQLHTKMCKIYKDQKINKIPLTTEITLKNLKFKNGTEKPVLRYNVIINNWEETRTDKEQFHPSYLVWCKEEQDFEPIDN